MSSRSRVVMALGRVVGGERDATLYRLIVGEDQVVWVSRSGGAFQRGPSMRPEGSRRLPERRVGRG